MINFDDSLSGSHFKWFIGIVENRGDPLQIGRVKVRCFGVHTYDTTKLPTEDLPWASVMLSTSNAGVNGVGAPVHGLIEGSTVVGFFLDGDSAQYPIVLGTIAGKQTDEIPNPSVTYATQYNTTNFEQGESDLNILGRESPIDISHPMLTNLQDFYVSKVNTAQGSRLYKASGTAHSEDYYTSSQWSEPIPRGGHTSSQYPLNKVTQTESGHIIEYDDSLDNPRIMMYHNSGTFQEFSLGGNRVVKVVGKDFEISLQDKNIYVKGNCNLTVDGDMKHLVRGDYFLEVEQDYRILVHGSICTKITGNDEREIDGYESIFVGAESKVTVSDRVTNTFGGGIREYVNGDYSISVSGLAPVYSVSSGSLPGLGLIQFTSSGTIDSVAITGIGIKAAVTQIGDVTTPTVISGSSIALATPGAIAMGAGGAIITTSAGATSIFASIINLN